MAGALDGYSPMAPIKSIKPGTSKVIFMPQRKSKNTDPWSKLDAYFAGSIEPTGPEWFTAKDLKDKFKMSESTVRRRVKSMLIDGLLDIWAGGSAETKKYCVKYRFR